MRRKQQVHPPTFLQRTLLPFVTCLTGTCVLIIEVLATRILAPYFGNTIYTVSSVITCILAALSIGYYAGGKIVDRWPEKFLFYGIIFISGGSVIGLQVLVAVLLPSIGYGLPIDAGPLIASFLLFFLPSLLLGLLSPFAIGLQSRELPDAGIGSVSGNIFFWSTAGSIIGSLLSGFYLIPHFGIQVILSGVGIMLLVVGGAGCIVLKRRKIVFLFMLLFLSVVSVQLLGFKRQHIVYEKDGFYERLLVYDASYQGHPTRFFFQDRTLSGGMFLDRNDLVFDYTKYYQLYKLFTPQVKQVLILGAGAYAIPKAFLQADSSVQVDVVDIEPFLPDIAQQYFRVSKDPRMTTYLEDGRRYLHDTHKTYDVIYSDVFYSLYSIPGHFTTQEFLQLAKSKLRPNGLYIANFIGTLSPQRPSLIFSEMRTLRTVFPNSYEFAVNTPESQSLQNIILLGIHGDRRLDITRARNDAFLAKIVTHQLNTSNAQLEQYPLLTDDYSPTEFFTAAVIRNALKH